MKNKEDYNKSKENTQLDGIPWDYETSFFSLISLLHNHVSYFHIIMKMIIPVI